MLPTDLQLPDQSRSIPEDDEPADHPWILAILYVFVILLSCCSGWMLTIQGVRREEPLWPQGSALRGAEDLSSLVVIICPTIAGPLLFLVIALSYAWLYFRWDCSPRSYRHVFSSRNNDRRWLGAYGALFLFVASMVMFGFAHYRIYHPFNGIRPDVVPFRDDTFTANFVLTLTVLGFLSFVAGGVLALFSIINLFVAMQRPPGWPR